MQFTGRLIYITMADISADYFDKHSWLQCLFPLYTYFFMSLFVKNTVISSSFIKSK